MNKRKARKEEESKEGITMGKDERKKWKVWRNKQQVREEQLESIEASSRSNYEVQKERTRGIDGTITKRPNNNTDKTFTRFFSSENVIPILGKYSLFQ